MSVFIKTIAGKTITFNVTQNDDMHRTKRLIEAKTEVPHGDQSLSVHGKTFEDEMTIQDCGICADSTVHMSAKLRGGGMEEADIRSAFGNLERMLKEVEAKLEAEKARNEDLRKTMDKKRVEKESSLISAIRKGQMKEIQRKKFASNQNSGNFKAWAKDMKDYIFWHDARSKELLELFEAEWSMDEKLDYEKVKRICEHKFVEIEVDSALHMVIGAFLEGESKVLAETCDMHNPATKGTHWSGWNCGAY